MLNRNSDINYNPLRFVWMHYGVKLNVQNGGIGDFINYLINDEKENKNKI